MSIRVYSEINLHITWHTKDSLPMISAEMQPTLYSFLKNKVVVANRFVRNALVWTARASDTPGESRHVSGPPSGGLSFS
jgi:hypothetical protein